MADPVTFVIDISHHQDKNLNLAQARADGCELAILKAGEGTDFIDPDFASNLAEARAAGQLLAAYWYQRSNATAAAHVAAITRTVPSDVAVVPDVEANSGGVALTRDIVAGLRSAGYRVPWTYLPRWYWQQIGSPPLVGLPPLWSSRYPDNVVGLLATEWAAVPASYWAGYGGLDVGLLQFTSSARIAGYQPLDASAFRGTRDRLAALLHQEDDMQLTDPMPLFSKNEDGSPEMVQVQQCLAGIFARVADQGRAIAELGAAIAAISKDPVAQGDVQISGTVHIGPADGAA